jgi:hypothetical protein
MSEQEINLKGLSTSHRLAATKFLEEVVELAAKGYVLHPKPVSVRQLPSFMTQPRATMVTKERANEILGIAAKEAVAEKEATNLPLVKLKTLNRKDELLSFSKQEDLSVPDETIKKGVKSIKQHLINQLSE